MTQQSVVVETALTSSGSELKLWRQFDHWTDTDPQVTSALTPDLVVVYLRPPAGWTVVWLHMHLMTSIKTVCHIIALE